MFSILFLGLVGCAQLKAQESCEERLVSSSDNSHMIAQPQCDPQEQHWTVVSAGDVSNLSKALEGCEDGLFRVDWIGHVITETTIKVSRTTLMIAGGGNGLDATVDGNGTTQLFYIEDATLNLSNMTLINGRTEGFGGAIYASDSRVNFDGMMTFADNQASSGGAIEAYRSFLSWNGHITFANNTVAAVSEAIWHNLGFDGGALTAWCFSTVSSRGTVRFLHNTADHDAGALRIASHSKAEWHGLTHFEDNRAVNNGGAVLETHNTSVYFFGTTVIKTNSAGISGGSIAIYGSSGVPSKMVFHNTTTVSNNKAGHDGGAIFVKEGCDISWDGQMTFFENTADNDGGAVTVSGDSALTSSGSTLFQRNSADSYGGAIYSFANVNGQSYDGVKFDSNSASRGGAVATFSTGQESQNTYMNCVFQNNVAGATGGAVEASIGKDQFINSSFWNNSAGAGGALKLSGTVEMSNVTFGRNSATSEGPAISNIGGIENMSFVSFVGNYFTCSAGEFLEFVEVNDGTARFTVVCHGCDGLESCDNCEIADDALVPTCSAALDHTSADQDGMSLEELDIDKGYWRATNRSKIILGCYNTDACKGGKTGTLGYCETGYADMGPYCSVCEDGYSATLAFTCGKCSSSNHAAVLALVVVVMVGAAAGAIYLTAYLVSIEPVETRMTRPHIKLLKAVPLQAIKIIVVLWQILTQFASVANVTYPNVYEKFLQAIDVMNLDLGWMLSAGCIWPGVDFHDRLLFTTLGPLVALAYLGVTYTFAVGKTIRQSVYPLSYRALGAGARKRVKRAHMSALILLSFLVYSSASSTVFQMFACERLDDGNIYLRADYRILCTDPKHRALQLYAAIMIVVYPVGIPLMYTLLLYRLRRVLKKGNPARLNNPSASIVNSLWAPYRPGCYFYEVIECLRRIMLTGVTVFIFPGDAAQIAVTIVISSAFSLVSEAARPYESDLETWLSRAGYAVLFLSFFAALLYKVDVSNEREASQEAFGIVLVVVHVALVLTVLFHALGLWITRNTEDPLPRPLSSSRAHTATVVAVFEDEDD